MKYLLMIFLIIASSFLFAENTYKPYILTNINPDSVETILQNNNFEIIGKYEFTPDTKIIVFTCNTLKKIAKENNNGIFFAPMRLAITKGKVSYTNPRYWAYAYRIKSKEIDKLNKKIIKALGKTKEFGSEKGLTEKKLRKYKYMIGMPKFTDLIKIAELKDHKIAVNKLQKALEEKNALIYKIDLGNTTLFGIKILGNHDGADKIVMNTLNSFTKGPLHTAYLPYEVLVSDNGIYIFNGKFRIALSFPDLSMGQFMKIKNAPKNIKKYVKSLIEK